MKGINIIKTLYDSMQDDEGGKRREKKAHSPSEATKCIRQLWYRWKNETISDPVDEPGWFKMRMGDAVHDGIRALLKRKLDIIDEVKGTKNIPGLFYPINFRVDSLLVNPETGRTEGLEIKSTFGRAIDTIKKSGVPKPSDETQTLIYLYLSDDNINHWNLLYVSRDTGYMQQFRYERCHGKFYRDALELQVTERGLFKKFFELEAALEHDTPPVGEFGVVIKAGEVKDKIQHKNVEYKSDWQCLYCPYITLCKEPKKYKFSIPAINLAEFAF